MRTADWTVSLAARIATFICLVTNCSISPTCSAVGGAQFVIFDANEVEHGAFVLSHERREDLERVLAAHDGLGPRFLALHPPPHPLHAPSTWVFYPANFADADGEALREIARRHGVSHVLTGHAHLYARREERGVVYLTSGGGGAHLHEVPVPEGFDAKVVHHVVLLHVGPDGVREELVKLD